MTSGGAAADQALTRVPFPRYSIGLLQSESEMVQVPEYDLLPSLEHDERWDVELYTERTARVLFDSVERFDCIVVGYNAALKSEDVQEALRATEIPVGLVVLHQLEPAAFGFLADDERLLAERLSAPATDARAVLGADTREEILLNWPLPVDLASGILEGSSAHVGVTPSPGSRWETILEIRDGQRRVPVLLRTHPQRSPPRVVSTVLLAPRHDRHRALLGNLVMWCAAGRPTAVVVGQSGPSAAILQRKLRLQGVKAVTEPITKQSELDFRRWPLWGTRDVLLPSEWDPTRGEGWPRADPHNAKEWLRRGHRIILLGPDDRLTIRHGESDAHWVARRWATWFQSAPTEVWHGDRPGGGEHRGSIVATRSILRMLALLHRDGRGTRVPGLDTAHAVLDELEHRGTGIDAGALGLPGLHDFADAVGELLRRRIGSADNVDDTVSATIAALDVDALLGGEALGAHRAELERWLRRVGAQRALEDRLEIARRLGDADLLAQVIANADRDTRTDEPVSAVLVTALRSAIVACNLPPETPLSPLALRPDRAVVDRELRARPMLAAAYLIGALDLQRVWAPQPEEPARTLRDPPPEHVDRAVITLGRHGPLSRGQTGWAAPLPELASTEALALTIYFAREPVPTHVVREEEVVSPQVLGALLQEAESVRRVSEKLDLKLTHRTQTARRGGKAIALYGELLIVALVAVSWATVAPHVATVWEVPFGLGLFTLLTLALLALLGRYELLFRGATRVAPFLVGGVQAVREALGREIAGPPPEEPDEHDG